MAKIAMTNEKLTHPKSYLEWIIQPTIDEYRLAPHLFHREQNALIQLYHLHDRIFWYFKSIGRSLPGGHTAATVEDFCKALRQDANFRRLHGLANAYKHAFTDRDSTNQATATSGISYIAPATLVRVFPAPDREPALGEAEVEKVITEVLKLYEPFLV